MYRPTNFYLFLYLCNVISTKISLSVFSLLLSDMNSEISSIFPHFVSPLISFFPSHFPCSHLWVCSYHAAHFFHLLYILLYLEQLCLVLFCLLFFYLLSLLLVNVDIPGLTIAGCTTSSLTTLGSCRSSSWAPSPSTSWEGEAAWLQLTTSSPQCLGETGCLLF